jgi:Tol biopolymer transport system component
MGRVRKTLVLGLFLPLCALSLARVAEGEKVNPRKITSFYPGAVSLDGRYLSFTDWSTGDLAVKDLESGQRRQLTDKGSWLESDEFVQAIQAFSPNGKQIAYSLQKGRNCDLRIINIDGSASQILYQDDDLAYLLPEDWSSDGNSLLVWLQKKDGTMQIAVIDTRDGSARILATLHSNPLRMAFSPDGNWVAYDAPSNEGSLERDIYLIRTEGGERVGLVEQAGNDFLLGWVPEEDRILLASDRTGRLAAWTLRLEDGRPKGVPELIRDEIPPIEDCWITRGGSFYYGYVEWTNDVYVAELDPLAGALRKPVKLISHVGFQTSARWAPDGQHLAYAFGQGREPDPFVLAIRDFSSGREERFRLSLGRLGGHAFEPHWSFDGRSLLALGRSQAGDGLYRIDSQTGRFQPVLVGPIDQYMEWPVWSADGTSVLYRRFDPQGQGQVLVQRDLETGSESVLYRSHLPPASAHVGASRLAASPDGDYLAFIWSEFDEDGPQWSALKVIQTEVNGELSELVRATPPERILAPAWMPDGGELLFGRGREIGESRQFEIWKVPRENPEPQSFGFVMEDRELYSLSVHPNGERITFTAGLPRTEETWVMDRLLDRSRGRE